LKQQQAVRAGKWKLYRTAGKGGKITKQFLFNLESDIGEKNDLSGQHPEQLERLISIANETRFPSRQFPSPFDRVQP